MLISLLRYSDLGTASAAGKGDNVGAAMTPKGRPTLAEKIERLFETIHPAGRRPYTLQEVVDGIQERGGPVMSINQLWELRRGKKTNPRKDQLEALADFFGVPARYFLDDDEAVLQIHAELALLGAMRDAKIQDIAARATTLSPAALDAMVEMARRLQQLEGKANENSADNPPEGADS